MHVIQDSCTTHVKEKIKEIYGTHNITVSTIPGGCTKYLQPHDATIINSFKIQA